MEKEELEDSEHEYEEIEEGYTGFVYVFFAVVLLFLTSSGLLVYYQFYQGDGNWAFSLKKQPNYTELVDSLQIRNDELMAQIEELETTIAQKEAEQGEIELLVAEIAEEEKAAATAQQPPLEGTVYEVQIGAFQKADLSAYEDQLTSLNIDKEDYLQKFTMGRFEDLELARQFRNDIRRLGVKNAFLIKKVDGARVEAPGLNQP